jgi:hypothetical protein
MRSVFGTDIVRKTNHEIKYTSAYVGAGYIADVYIGLRDGSL